MPSFSRYPRSFEDPIDDHVRRAVVALGEKLVGKRAVYLDTNYWIRLRDANRGRKGTQKTVDLLRLLRHGVARGTLFCPIQRSRIHRTHETGGSFLPCIDSCTY